MDCPGEPKDMAGKTTSITSWSGQLSTQMNKNTGLPPPGPKSFGFNKNTGLLARPPCNWAPHNVLGFLTPRHVFEHLHRDWDFGSYDPRMKVNPLKFVTIGRDEKMMASFNDAVPQFIYEMDQVLTNVGIRFGDHWTALKSERE